MNKTVRIKLFSVGLKVVSGCRRHPNTLFYGHVKKPNNLNITGFYHDLCKELVVFRVCSNSSNYIHNFLSLFWGCSVAWPSLVVRGHATPVRNSFFCLRKKTWEKTGFALKIKEADESPGSPI